jgi:hypothetical protein
MAATTVAVKTATTATHEATTAEQKRAATVGIKGSRRRGIVDLHVAWRLAHRACAGFLIRDDARGRAGDGRCGNRHAGDCGTQQRCYEAQFDRHDLTFCSRDSICSVFPESPLQQRLSSRLAPIPGAASRNIRHPDNNTAPQYISLVASVLADTLLGHIGDQ